METHVLIQDKNTLRRRVAMAVLGNLLDDDALSQALWLQHETMRGDAVSDIITFIDAVGDRNLFDAATRRRLYTEFHQALKLPDDQLPIDPLPVMQALRAASAPLKSVASLSTDASFSSSAPSPVMVEPVRPQPPAVPVAAPVAPAPAATRVAPVQVAAPPVPGPAPEQPLVFGALMQSVLQEVNRFHRDAFAEVRKDALIELERSRVPIDQRPLVRDAWVRGIDHSWQLPLDLQVLGELVRVLYAALVAAFGRAGADQILRRAVQTAEALPEARRYSPRRLLHLL